jgi:hypothetical protein
VITKVIQIAGTMLAAVGLIGMMGGASMVWITAYLFMVLAGSVVAVACVVGTVAEVGRKRSARRELERFQREQLRSEFTRLLREAEMEVEEFLNPSPKPSPAELERARLMQNASAVPANAERIERLRYNLLANSIPGHIRWRN